MWALGHFNKNTLQNMVLIYNEQKDWANARYYLEQLNQRYTLDEKWQHLFDDVTYEINDTATFTQSLMGAFVLWIRRTLGFQVFSILLLLASFMLAAILLFQIPNKKWIGRISMVILFIGLSGIIIEAIEDKKSFIVVQSSAQLHIAPDEISEFSTILNPGHKVLILQTLGDWTEVQTANESKGWIHTTDRIL